MPNGLIAIEIEDEIIRLEPPIKYRNEKEMRNCYENILLSIDRRRNLRWEE
jgi:dihydropteroate synthase